jgi:hypothetical protein
LAGVCDTGTGLYGISEQTKIGVGRPFDGGGGRVKKRITRSNSGNSAMLAAMRRASSRVSDLPDAGTFQHFHCR